MDIVKLRMVVLIYRNGISRRFNDKDDIVVLDRKRVAALLISLNHLHAVAYADALQPDFLFVPDAITIRVNKYNASRHFLRQRCPRKSTCNQCPADFFHSYNYL